MCLFEVHVSKTVFGRVIRVGMGVGAILWAKLMHLNKRKAF